MSEAGAWLGAGGADVVAHSRVLTGGTIEVSYWAGAVGAGESSGSGLVGSCWEETQGAEPGQVEKLLHNWHSRDQS